MDDVPMVSVALVVLDTGARANKLANSFASMCEKNLLESQGEAETAGFSGKVNIPGLGALPAHLEVRWEDVDAEETVDDWVERQREDAPAFVVVMGYSQCTTPGYTTLAWARGPGYMPDTVGDIEDEAIAPLLGTEMSEVWQHKNLAAICTSLLVDHPKLHMLHEATGKLRANFQAEEIDTQTPPSPARPSARL